MARNDLIPDRSCLGDNCITLAYTLRSTSEVPCGCGHAAAKIVGCKRCMEMEGHAMSLSRNGYAVSTRRGSLGVLFSALLALALFDPGAATAQEVKQIKLTEKHIQGFLAASKDMAQL
jgi:hypothetical protein